jgi:8-oxo-dGTP pyrophosphatase MutT (NUDIX family)
MELNRQEVVAPPIDAASVVLLRPGTNGSLEVLLMRRHDDSDVLGGVYVFPGGKVDAADATVPLPAGREREMIERLGEPGLTDTAAAALYVAAARETFEEASIRLGLDALYPWARWITPRVPSMMRKRFDTRFFIAALPAGEEVSHDQRETVESLWIAPSEALQRYWDGAMRFAPPQIMSLAHLSRHPDPMVAIELAMAQPPGLIEPQSFEQDGCRVLVYPGDPRHSATARVLPGPSRLYWRNERFEPEDGFDGYFV